MDHMLGLLLLFQLIGQSLNARILLILPFPGRSHHGFDTAIMKALAQRGHQLVEYSPFPPAEPIPNHTHINVTTRAGVHMGNRTIEELKGFTHLYGSSIFGNKQKGIWEMNYEICKETFKHKAIRKLLKSKEKFDLVMTESAFGEESMLVFGHRFSAPTITIESYISFSLVNRDAGNALSIASVPDLTATTFPNKLMSFKDRTLNFISVMISLLSYHFIHIPLHDDIIREANYSGSPPVSQMVANVSLYFTNSHFTAVNYVHPYTPNIVPIGGIHINPDKKTLSQDIQQFMDGAHEGVIYFSFGTVIPAHQMSKDNHKVFINVFKKLPQRVLWSIKLDIPNLPKNVKLTKFAPQLGVLGHKNCKLFITHGGVFSHHEAIHSGVPTVRIPFFSDQPYLAQLSEHQGIGVTVDWRTLSENTFHTAITTVLHNSKYKENAVHLARIYRDRPMSPAQLVVYWVEYVLRHRGAPHLKPASALLAWYQDALLDVLSAILAFFIVSITILFFALRKLLCFICKRTEKFVQNREKKNE